MAVCCWSDTEARFAGAVVQQARVLDGDDGLGGEVLHELDLLVGKGTNFLAGHGKRADQFVLLQHGDSQNRPYPSEFDGCDDCWIAFFNVARLCRKIGDVNTVFAATMRP